MKGSFGIAAFLAALSPAAQAAPMAAPSGINDAVILNYALTLEHLENTFYRTALQNYTEADFASAGFDSFFYQRVKDLSSDETQHVQFLTMGLEAAGAAPVKECTYSFPVTDPKSFAMTAAILEGVGVSAYLGAAADIMNKTYLTDAGSILTVESRHSSYLRSAQDLAPFPNAFEVPLDFNEVYTLAAPFIASCPPDNPQLPVKAFPMLSVCPAQMSGVKTGDMVTYDAKMPIPMKDQQDLHGAFITLNGPVFVPVTIANGAMAVMAEVPEGVKGQSYFVLNNGCDMVSDDTVVAGPAIVEIM